MILNADFNLRGIWFTWDLERALSYRQSAQIIPSRAGLELTALAFWLAVFFFSFFKHVRSGLSAQKKSESWGEKSDSETADM